MPAMLAYPPIYEVFVIGIVIVTHGHLAQELLKTANFIIGDQERCQTVSIEMNLSPEYLKGEIGAAIKSQDQGGGVLILTDMFGGTPSNISLSFLKENQVEVISGASLPMLLRAIQLRKDKQWMTLSQLAEDVCEYARKSISTAGAVLNQRA
jgi:PTS system mannose-specific IIA component